jgi:hypothetical protein
MLVLVKLGSMNSEDAETVSTQPICMKPEDEQKGAH